MATKILLTQKFSVLGLLSEKQEDLSSSTNKKKGNDAEQQKPKQQAAAATKGGESKDTAAKDNNNKKKNKQQQQGEANNKTKEKAAAPAAPAVLTPELQGYYDRVRSVGEECVTEEELKNVVCNKKEEIRFYDGFEPSGRMHIAQGIFKAMNVNKCVSHPNKENGSKFVFWVADWFALMNDKMGGDLAKIQVVGEYLQQVWKAAGMDLRHVEFLWASKEITERASTYWPLMLNIASKFNITRIKKCCQIMGRLEGRLTAAQILYPLMQCTDVFFLNTDICQLGVDQRKVNMLAREYMDSVNKKKSRFKRKPIILSHHMLFGLKQGQEKMSKSDPDSAIFMEDTPEDVTRKINNAYCPTKEEEEAEQKKEGGGESMHLIEDKLKNPCLDYVQYIIFSPPNATFSIAGGKEYKDFGSVKTDFLNGTITEAQLKQGLINELNRLLQPVRDHFTNDPTAKHLLEQVQLFKKEAKSTTSDNSATTRRLNLVQHQSVPPKSSVVFAPLPNTNPSLQETMDVLYRLRSAIIQQQEPDDAAVVLYLSDWSARVCNACGGTGTTDGLDPNEDNIKGIDAYYTILISALKALDETTMSKVRVLRQSEAILLDPSNYWISVINVGRHFMLNDVMGDNDVKDSDNVGVIISRLMMVADVMGLEPSTISVLQNSVEQSLVQRFFDEKLSSGGMAAPKFVPVKVPQIRLQEEKQTEAEKTENDEYFVLDDSKVHGKSKLKKAFCKPGDISFCPPITLACAFTFDINIAASDAIVISRSEENGGNATFANEQELSASFENGSLHPGDLKATTTTIMVKVLEKLNSTMKNEKETTKCIKFLKAYQKKLLKNKKKK